jgi:single-strand DNA-binding protein
MANGDQVVAFDLAVDTGAKQAPATMFLSVSCFGKTAEIVSQYAGTKGTQLGVTGRLRQENWDDKATGAKRSKISCVAERVTLIGGRKDSADQSPSQYSGSDSQAPAAEQAANGFGGSREVDPNIEIPF